MRRRNLATDMEAELHGERRNPNPAQSQEEEVEESSGDGGMVLELPLGDAAAEFDLERAVCSHGLFMMAPNHWDPHSKSLLRPLRLSLPPFDSVLVRISHPPQNPNSLRICVYGNQSLSPQRQQFLLAQVGRMLHLSEGEERTVREFQEMMQRGIMAGAEEEERSFNGRMFRSPTLFEDMVKCILLCNCQWPRTLSMARALCELQMELRMSSSKVSSADADSSISTSPKIKSDSFVPKTPAGKESKRETRACKISKNLMSKFTVTNSELEADSNSGNLAQNTDSLQRTDEISPPSLVSSKNNEYVHDYHNSCQGSTAYFFHDKIGNFPSPEELASLNESFLAKRCGLGYRASRILNLARIVVEGRIQLEQLDEVLNGASLTKYNELAEQLKEINGFGPFTCANVLVCMGFYHVIPSDSETIRHIKQVHGRSSTTQTVQSVVEDIYGKYTPFQFLAYWSEVWHFYEKRFGKLSEMPHSHYKLITASNMRVGGKGKPKRLKTAHEEGTLINSNSKNAKPSQPAPGDCSNIPTALFRTRKSMLKNIRKVTAVGCSQPNKLC